MMLYINTSNIKYSTVVASFTVTYSVAPDEINSLLILHDNFAKNNGKAYQISASDTEPQMETQISNLTFEKADEGCKGCKHYKLTCDLFSEICKYESQTERSSE